MLTLTLAVEEVREAVFFSFEMLTGFTEEIIHSAITLSATFAYFLKHAIIHSANQVATLQ